jgi:hypothetical protein
LSGPGIKAPHPFLFFFFSFSQQAEGRASIGIKLSDILDPYLWKASLCPAALRKAMPFLPTGWLQSSLHESEEQTGEHHALYRTPLPTPWEHNLAQLLGILNPPPAKPNSINSKL